MAVGTRGVRRRRTVKVGADKYRIGKKATRTVAKPDASTKKITLTKKAGGSVVKTLTKSSEAKNMRLGAYARSHKTVNSDGTVTYAKKGGGTVTKSLSVSGTPKKKNGRRSTNTDNPDGTNNDNPNREDNGT